MRYNAFLAHNSLDKDDVKILYDYLDKLGIYLWIDFREIIDGKLAAQSIEEGMKKSDYMIFCLGRNGPGPYQNLEVDIFNDLKAQNKIDMITVALPDYDPMADKTAWLIEPEFIFEDTVHDKQTLNAIYDKIMDEVPPSFEIDEDDQIPQGHYSPDHAIETIDDWFVDERATVFIGEQTSVGDNLAPEKACITQDLLKDLGIPDTGQPIPAFEHVCMYSSIEMNGMRRVEAKVKEMYTQSLSCIPEAYKKLADLYTLAGQNDTTTNGDGVDPRLVFTTNTDLLIEMAFLLEGLPFTRIVLCPHGKKGLKVVQTIFPKNLALQAGCGRPNLTILQEHIESQKGEEIKVVKDGKNDPDVVRNARAKESSGPLLFKYFGSLDILDSCFISSERLYNLTKSSRDIPAQVTSIMSNTPNLYLGYSLLDLSLQHVYETLILGGDRDTYDNLDNFFIRNRKVLEQQSGCIMEKLIWDKLGRNANDFKCDPIAIDPRVFLHRCMVELRSNTWQQALEAAEMTVTKIKAAQARDNGGIEGAPS